MREDVATVSLNPWGQRIFTIIVLGLFACLNATVAPQQPGIVTSLWYVNALTVVTLLNHQPCYRALLLAGYAIGLSVGYELNHLSETAHLTFMLANLAEILVAVRLLERGQCVRGFYLNIHAALKLGLCGILLPPLAGTLVVVAGSMSLIPPRGFEMGMAWYINAVICNTAVLPLLLLIKHHRWNKDISWLWIARSLLWLGYTVMILTYFPFPFIYLGLGLVLIAIRYGILGTALAGFLAFFCIAVFIRMAWFSWPPYDKPLFIVFVYLPVFITLIAPPLLAIFVDAWHTRERQLLARESMFREAMEVSAIGMALISTDGQLLKVNRALCEMLNYTESELTNRLWSQLLYPDDLAADVYLQQQLLNNQQSSYRREARYLRKNKQALWVLLVVSIVWDTQGLPHYFVLQVENIDDRRRSEARERELFNRYLLAIEAGQIGVWELRPDNQILNWDERMFELYGLDRRYIIPSFSIWKSCIHPADLPKLLRQIDTALHETNVLDSEFRVIHRDDSIHYLRTHAMVERDSAGKVSRMVGTSWDITELRMLMNDLSHERELLRTTLLSIGEAVIMTDQEARVVFMNPAAERILLSATNKVIYRAIDTVMQIVDADGNPLANPLHSALLQRRLVSLNNDAYLKLADGSMLAIQDSAAPILRNNKELLGGVLVFSDVTEMRSLQKRLGYQASHDPLTGLINRSAFETILQDVVKESVMMAGHSVLVFLDLDHFKQVNDSAGHAAGDELLKQLAVLMNARMRASDIVGRLGGDEFGIIFRNCSVEYAETLMHEMIAEICQFEFRWEEQIFHVGASAGLVPIHDQFASFNALLACADQACYDAKRAGRGQVKTVSLSF